MSRKNNRHRHQAKVKAPATAATKPTAADKAVRSPTNVRFAKNSEVPTSRNLAAKSIADAALSEMAVDISGAWDGTDNNKSLVGTRRAGGQAPRGATAGKHTQAFSEMIGSYSSFLVDPEQDRYDQLDLYAQHVLDMLMSNVFTFAHLSRFERDVLFRYFYKTNPVLGRIIDLHTDLPLSKTRLQAPANLPNIAKDYIMQFYDRVLERIRFPEFLRDLVLTQCIYGEAVALVDDYYQRFDRVLQDLEVLEEKAFDYTEEDQKFLDIVEAKYEDEPKSVKVSDRLKYIKMKFQNFFEPDYTGPDRLQVVPFWRIDESLENDDIDYFAIKLHLSEHMEQLMNADVDSTFMREVGYSSGMLALVQDRTIREDTCVTIDNDVYEGLPYVFRMRRPEGASMIVRVLNECIEWESAKRAMRAKIESVGKIGRVITADGLSDAQTAALKAEVQLMLDDPGYAIVANFEINWEEVNGDLRQHLDEITDAADKITEMLSLGAGMPQSLISGDSQYSGSTIKLEILNVEYHNFKQRVQTLIETHLLKPIALRKGFVAIDDWGNPQICYPRLTFSRVSLRDESVYDILFSLYQKGSLPVGIIYDILNLDQDDVKRGIEADLFTSLDPNFNGLITDILTAAAPDVYANSDLVERLTKELNVTKTAPTSNAGMSSDGSSYDPDTGGFLAPTPGATSPGGAAAPALPTPKDPGGSAGAALAMPEGGPSMDDGSGSSDSSDQWKPPAAPTPGSTPSVSPDDNPPKPPKMTAPPTLPAPSVPTPAPGAPKDEGDT